MVALGWKHGPEIKHNERRCRAMPVAIDLALVLN
jgi:hypothetical protein